MSDLQFATLDYQSAELYTSLTQRPPTATPLNIPLPDLSQKPPSKNLDPLNEAFRLEEQARQREIFKAEKEAYDNRMRDLREKEIARNRELQNRKPVPVEEGAVRTRDYEAQYEKPKSAEPVQPKPSPAEPPTTPQNSGARPTPEQAPGIPPKSGQPTKPASPNISKPGGIPRSLPVAAGRYAIPAVFATLDFGLRVVNGQSIAQAAVGTAGGVAGSLVGAAIGGALGGPIGAFAGSMIGGVIGGGIADYIYRLVVPPTGRPPIPVVTGPYPFFGGQGAGVFYRVSGNSIINTNGSLGDGGFSVTVYGPIRSVRISGYDAVPGSTGVGAIVDAYDALGNPISVGQGYGAAGVSFSYNLSNISIERLDGLPDTAGNPAPNPIPADNRLPGSVFHPGNNDYYPGSAYPGDGQARPNNGVSSGAPGTGTPRPSSESQIGGGFPAPRKNPNPAVTPSGLGGNLPDFAPAPTPSPYGNPSSLGGSNPSGSTGTGNSSTGNPTAVPSPRSGGGASFSVPVSATGGANTTFAEPAQPIPLGSSKSSVGGSPYPVKNRVPDPSPAANPNPTTTDKKVEDLEKEIIRQGTALAIITSILTQLRDRPSPINRDQTKDVVQEAVCEISQPDRCLGSPIKNNSDKLDNIGTKLDALNLGSNAAQLALLNTINTKIGEQLPGGLAGKLTRFSQWLQLDRALNLMILAATIHNAMMLTNDIGQTLLGAINNVLTLIGLKGDDGQPFNLGEIISSGIENLIKGIIGADNYVALTTAVAKANRIYQATTNILNSFQSLTSTVLNALEITVGRIGKIGNALRKSGEVLENAYGWMNPQPKFNRVTQILESLQNGASTIQMVTQAPLDIINATTEMTNASTEFVNAIKDDGTPANITTPEPEPDVLKAAEAAIKEASAGQEMTDPDLEADE